MLSGISDCPLHVPDLSNLMKSYRRSALKLGLDVFGDQSSQDQNYQTEKKI